MDVIMEYELALFFIIYLGFFIGISMISYFLGATNQLDKIRRELEYRHAMRQMCDFKEEHND